jgi:transposase
MPKPYSLDLRERVVDAVVAGASRREVAEQYGLSPSAVVLWLQRWEATGSVEALPIGGSRSPLEDHAEFLLDLVAESTKTRVRHQRWRHEAGIPGCGLARKCCAASR